MCPGLVIFDCDGVLVDSERLTVGVEARVLTDLGWPMTVEGVVERWMGRTGETQLAEIADRLGADVAREFDESTTREVHAAFDAELTEVDGVGRLVDLLEAHHVRTCVASSGSRGRIRRTLGLTGLLDRFTGRIFSGTEVEHGKPAPDLFLQAAGVMGVAPGDCVVIEDSVYGVRAGVAAGMRVLGHGDGLVAPEVLTAVGAEVFGHMDDVAELLGISRR